MTDTWRRRGMYTKLSGKRDRIPTKLWKAAKGSTEEAIPEITRCGMPQETGRIFQVRQYRGVMDVHIAPLFLLPKSQKEHVTSAKK